MFSRTKNNAIFIFYHRKIKEYTTQWRKTYEAQVAIHMEAILQNHGDAHTKKHQ